jgi:hypothetical protein
MKKRKLNFPKLPISMPFPLHIIAILFFLLQFTGMRVNANPFTFPEIETIPVQEILPNPYFTAGEQVVSLPGYARARQIEINYPLLTAPANQIHFDLFDGLAVLGEVTEVKTVLGTIVVIKGEILPNQGDFLLVKDGAVVSGGISVQNQKFSIRHTENGDHFLVENDPNESFSCGTISINS